MKRYLSCIAVAALAGCASPSQQGPEAANKAAIDTARERGLTQWKCTEVTGNVLGRTALPFAAGYAGPERIQYTVGVEGCGKSMNVIVICDAGTPCYVAGTDNRK